MKTAGSHTPFIGQTPGAQAKAIVDAGEPLFRELEEQSVGLAVEVQLNVASKGAPVEWRRLEGLSKGQRATALLLLLLGASMSPLVSSSTNPKMTSITGSSTTASFRSCDPSKAPDS